jgi:hypothetical protein
VVFFRLPPKAGEKCSYAEVPGTSFQISILLRLKHQVNLMIGTGMKKLITGFCPVRTSTPQCEADNISNIFPTHFY